MPSQRKKKVNYSSVIEFEGVYVGLKPGSSWTYLVMKIKSGAAQRPYLDAELSPNLMASDMRPNTYILCRQTGGGIQIVRTLRKLGETAMKARRSEITTSR